MGAPPPNASTHDPRAYLASLWRWKFLLLAILVAIPLATYLVVRRERRVYQSSTLLEIQPQAQASSAALLGGAAAPSDTPSSDAAVAARLLSTTKTARQAAARLGLPFSAAPSLLAETTATGDLSGFVTVTAQDHNSARAADVANAFARSLISQRTGTAVQAIDASIADLQSQLSTLARADPVRSELLVRLHDLSALRATQPGGVQIVDPATAVSTPIAPRLVHSVILSGIAALLLGIGAVALAETFDRRIREADDLESLTGLPVLSSIPTSSFAGGNLSNVDHEAFYRLRAALTYFNIDRRISSVLITSATKGDGKTTVTTNLAIALARAGRDVIVIDADLRRPTASGRLGIGEPSRGLGGLLVGVLSLDDVLVEIPTPGAGVGRLRVLPSGTPPPNPSELIASRRMRELIAELAEQSDIVVVDSTPVLAVSDSLPLMNIVSGVVLVARLGATSRDELTRLQSIVSSAGGSTLGVVATDAAAAALYSGYAAMATPTRKHRGRRRTRGESAPEDGVDGADGPESRAPQASVSRGLSGGGSD